MSWDNHNPSIEDVWPYESLYNEPQNAQKHLMERAKWGAAIILGHHLRCATQLLFPPDWPLTEPRRVV